MDMCLQKKKKHSIVLMTIFIYRTATWKVLVHTARNPVLEEISRDDEVVAAAREAGVAMYLTGARHFTH